MFSLYHERADLHFTWDGGNQIYLRPGKFAPSEAFPACFDIHVPDLRYPAGHPLYPAGVPVHCVPETQAAFEAVCDTWWRGQEICVGGQKPVVRRAT